MIDRDFVAIAFRFMTNDQRTSLPREMAG